MGNAERYLTVADELIEFADAAWAYFETRGYTVTAERSEIGYPFTPTLYCRRHVETLFIEVDLAVRRARVDEWVRYAKSCNGDTRVGLVMPTNCERTDDDEAALADLGVGLFVAADDRVREVLIPRDLAMTGELPDLASMPPKLRRLLGPAYDQYERSHWREGFEEACQVLESEARRYLKEGLRRKRIIVLDEQGKAVSLTDSRVDRMTLGQLAAHFGRIQVQTHMDSVIGEVLARINKDRVAVAHHKTKAATERKLRKNVPQHMWRVAAALKAMHGVK